MAPAKRRAVEEAETVDVLESASSELRRRSIPKRPRLASVQSDDTAPSRGDAATTYSDDALFQSTQAGRSGTIREVYERARDDGLNQYDLADSDDDESSGRRTQQMSVGGRQLNQEVGSGVIESITCINFMCHNKLQVKLGPLINFIVGHNGSGKSAVLTAITLCLGAKASSTNRGQSLRSFIKEGTDMATLIVKIKNQGDGPFRHDVYGDSIIVERWFTIDNKAGFRIKAASGKQISTKKAELEAITDHYAMQLDNPVTVLNQDSAREFLNASNPTDKYRFFYRGTNLEQLDKDYILVSESLDLTDRMLERVAEDVTVLKKARDEAKRSLDKAKSIQSLEDKIAKYTRQMAWVQVEHEETKLQECQDALREAEEQISQRQQDSTQFSEAFDQAKSSLERSTELLDQAKQNLERSKVQQTPVAEEHKKINEKISSSLTEGRAMDSERKAAEDDVKKAERELQQEYDRLEAANGGGHSLKVEQIKEAEEELEALRNEQAQHEERQPERENRSTAARDAIKDAEESLRQSREESSKADARLQSLKRDNIREDAAFHPTLEQILKAIQSEKRWRRPPVGPIGRHIKILKPEWSPIIESAIGRTLNGFAVTCKADQTLLMGILKKFQHWSNEQIFITNPTPMHRPELEPDEQFDTILRALQIDDDVVRNILIMNHMVDTTILIPDRNELRRTMFTADVNQRPRNVRAGIAFQAKGAGDDGIRFAYGRGRTEKSDLVRKYTLTPRMRTDAAAQIEIQQAHVQQLKQRLKAAEDHKRQCQTEATKSNQAIAAAEKRTKDLRKSITEKQLTIDTLQNELEDLSPTDGSLEALQSELDEKRERFASATAQFRLWEENNQKAAEERKRILPELERFEVEQHNIQKDIDKLGQRIEKAKTKRERALRDKNEAFERINDATRRRDEQQKNIDEQQATVEEFIGDASKFGARVPIDPGETVETLDKMLISLDRRKKDFEREMGGDRRAIEMQYLEANERLRKGRADETQLRSLWQTLARSLQDRQTRWRFFLQNISQRARMHFSILLSERGFQGRMLLDHKSKGLELRVQPNVTFDSRGKPRDNGTQTKSLSGGEKSFSTICLLLALWEAMSSPIRCLDEFDVFMDSINREISMRLMINFARKSPGKQYILITPQAMGNIDFGPDCHIHKLNDPERGQTTLSF